MTDVGTPEGHITFDYSQVEVKGNVKSLTNAPGTSSREVNNTIALLRRYLSPNTLVADSSIGEPTQTVPNYIQS
jgi:hypothetical protein